MARPVTTNGQAKHYGSTLQGPVNSTLVKGSTPSFVQIEGKPIILAGDKINTPSHIYDYDEFGSPLYHSHPNQSIDDENYGPSYWQINGGSPRWLLVGSSNTANDTVITSEGQSFVNVN
jgi:hypothetical protein